MMILNLNGIVLHAVVDSYLFLQMILAILCVYTNKNTYDYGVLRFPSYEHLGILKSKADGTE